MIECIICKKQFDKFDDYDRHLKTDHDILSVKERICDILSSRYDITRNYKGAIFSSDVHINDYKMLVEIFPENQIMKLKALEFEKPYLEIISATSKEEIIRQVERVAKGLDSTSIYTDAECKKEIDNITKNDGKPNVRSKLNRMIYKFQPSFFETENRIWMHDPVKRRYLIENRKKYLFKDEYMISDREYLSGMKISGIYKGYSHFNPLLLKWIVNNYFYGTETELYLPCCGWGHKLLIANCVKSIYAIDNNDKIIDGLKNIVAFSQFENVEIQYDDASQVTYSNSNSTFVCPPYFNTEIYKNKYKTYAEYKRFLGLLLRKCFDESSSKKLGIVIDGKNVPPILEMYPDASVIDLNNMKNHFTACKNNNEYFIFAEK